MVPVELLGDLDDLHRHRLRRAKVGQLTVIALVAAENKDRTIYCGADSPEVWAEVLQALREHRLMTRLTTVPTEDQEE
jgi:hypothetical protein